MGQIKKFIIGPYIDEIGAIYEHYFSHPIGFSHILRFFPKMPLRFPDFIIRNGVFLCYRMKNGVTDFLGFCNPETSKIGRVT